MFVSFKKKNYFKNNLKKIFYKISFFLLLTLNPFDYKKKLRFVYVLLVKKKIDIL